MKKTLFVLGLVLVLGISMATAEAKKGTLTGFVSDAKCAAKGARAQHAGCAKKCIEGGQAAVLATAEGAVYQITNQDSIKGHEGHNVKIAGLVDADAKTVTIEKLTMVEEKKE